MKHLLIIICATLLILSNKAFTQDVRLTISTSSLEAAVKTMLDARAIAAYDVSSGYGVSNWNVRLTYSSTYPVELELLSANRFRLACGYIARANINLNVLKFDINAEGPITIEGDLVYEAGAAELTLAGHATALIDIESTPAFLQTMIDGYEFIVKLPEFELGTYTFMLPDIPEAYFATTMPTISVLGDNLQLGLQSSIQVLTLDQLRENGTRLEETSIDVWQNNAFEENLIENRPLIANFGRSPHTFRALQDPVENPKEKFNQWNDFPDVQNHQTFLMDNSITNLTSNFKSSHLATVRIDLLGSPVQEGGKIEFLDPWLIDYEDPAFGNSRRNRSLEATFIARNASLSTLLTLDYTTSYNGDIYNGVFLNQNPQFQSGIPFYSIQSSAQTFTVNNKLITWDWESWDYDPAKIDLQYPNSNSTGIVFKSAEATITANLKGRKTSDNALATFGNNGGKISTHWASATQRSLQMLYEDRGHIYRAYQDQSFTWQKDAKIASPTADITLSRPAIDYFYDLSTAPGDNSGYVWQSFNSSSNRWSIASNLGSYPGTLSLTEEPAPAISGYSNGSSSISGVIVYRNPVLTPEGESGGDALELWFTNDDEIAMISGGTDAQFPAIDNREYPQSISQFYEPHYMLTWQNSNGIAYIELQREEDQGDEVSTEHSTVLSAGQSSLSQHEFPSIDVGGIFPEGDEMVHVVWEAIEDGGQIEKTSAPGGKLTIGCPPASMDVPVVCFRQKAGGLLNNWEPVVIFQTGNTCDRKPVVSSWPNGSQRDIAIAYEGAEGRTDYVLRQNGTWSTSSVLTSDGPIRH